MELSVNSKAFKAQVSFPLEAKIKAKFYVLPGLHEIRTYFLFRGILEMKIS